MLGKYPRRTVTGLLVPPPVVPEMVVGLAAVEEDPHAAAANTSAARRAAAPRLPIPFFPSLPLYMTGFIDIRSKVPRC